MNGVKKMHGFLIRYLLHLLSIKPERTSDEDKLVEGICE